VLERTLELWEKHSDDIIDCYIVANMELENETELYSFDKKISKLGIKCVSPVSLS
jgi:predicted nucleic acid-binding protein